MWLILACIFSFAHAINSWTIETAVTTVRIVPQTVEITNDISLNSPKPADKLHFAAFDNNVAHITAFAGNEVLPLRQLNGMTATWEITLPEKTTHASISVTVYYTALVGLLKRKIAAGEQQTWIFRGNVNVFSPYITQKQEVILHIMGKRQSTMGPFYNVPPFTARNETIQFKGNYPVAYAPKIVRELSISNWGKIFIQDDVTLENRAAISNEAFSRLNLPQTALKEWISLIPARAENIYYGDGIGRIHSILTRSTRHDTEVKLQARYPLIAGWKTNYELSYQLPIYDYVKTNGSNFCLNIPFIDVLFSPMVVADLTLKIALPEESYLSSEQLPPGFTRKPDEWKHATFDTFGRRVLVFNKQNLVEEAISDINICYANDLSFLSRYSMNGVRASLYIWSIFFAFVFISRVSDYI